ncbi:MAG: penicillin-binding protein 2 [Actinomycetia bacterium]|nr:penicillin-binding protein 2 [Actinomycetes bacterium]
MNKKNTKALRLDRYQIIFGVTIVVAFLLLIRLVQIQIFAADSLAQDAQNQRTAIASSKAKRGTIYDRNGVALATSVDKVSIYVNKNQMKNQRETATAIAQVLGGKVVDWEQKISNSGVNSDGQGVVNVCLLRFGSADLEKKFDNYRQQLKKQSQDASNSVNNLSTSLYNTFAISSDGHDYVVQRAEALDCINFDHEYQREYPYKSIGAQVIGRVDPESGHGLSGLEKEYDSILSGQDGVVYEEVSGDGVPLPNGEQNVKQVGRDGDSITVSLDIEVQQSVESLLAKYGKLGKAKAGNVVLIDGGSGEIYAAASLPLLDRDNITAEDVQAGAINLQGITRGYEPGSTMKSVATAALLENGAVKLSKRILVPDNRFIDGYPVGDWYDHPAQMMDLRAILEHSSNVGISMLCESLSKEQLYDYYCKAGFYSPTGVDYVGDGLKEPDVYDYVPLEQWSAVRLANVTFGQGLYVTSLQMASFYGAIANDGVRCQPHFLISSTSANAPVLTSSKRIMSSATASTMTDLLKSVVTDGTGKPAAVHGYSVAGKTGTAEVANPNGGGYSGNIIGSMVGYFANSDCKLVCMTSMDDPEIVGVAVAPKPLFAAIMGYVANRYMVAPDPAAAKSGGKVANGGATGGAASSSATTVGGSASSQAASSTAAGSTTAANATASSTPATDSAE